MEGTFSTVNVTSGDEFYVAQLPSSAGSPLRAFGLQVGHCSLPQQACMNI